MIKEDELGLVLLDLWCAKIKNIDIFEIVSHIEQYGKTWFLSMKWVTLAVMEFWSLYNLVWFASNPLEEIISG